MSLVWRVLLASCALLAIINVILLNLLLSYSVVGALSQPSPNDSRTEWNTKLTEALSTPLPSSTLRICLFTADVPFSSGHGGTATATLLLAQHLVKTDVFNVTLVALPRPEEINLEASCKSSTTAWFAEYGVNFMCLKPEDLLSDDGSSLVSTQYWDAYSYGVLRWLDRHPGECEVVHGHEWGGMYANLALVLQLNPDKYPNMRLVISTHGGHMWASIGLPTRPSQVGDLRVDHMEKLTIEWADLLVSPSRYMLGYFVTRGWSVVHRMVIPNIVSAETAMITDNIARKKVRDIVFVGRLEERKGVRIFMDVLDRLSVTGYWKIRGDPPPQVYMYGSAAMIEGRNSVDWLRNKINISSWSFSVQVLTGVKRPEILSRLQSGNFLLLVPSLQENLPYVLAEAAIARVPLVTFDVGASREVLKLGAGDDLTFCAEATVECMYQHAHTILKRGSHFIPRLSDSMSSASEQWSNLYRAMSVLPKISGATFSPQVKVTVQHLTKNFTTSSLLEKNCNTASFLPGVVSDGDDEALLLLPEQYEVIPSMTKRSQTLMQKLFAGFNGEKKHMRKIGALAFGVKMDGRSISFPTAPTWLLYSQDPSHCETQFPLLVRRRVLCEAFAVDPHVFPVFEPWILADVLNQQDLMVATYPEVLFQYRKGYSVGQTSPHPRCQWWSPPVGRYYKPEVLDHLHRDVSEDMRNIHFSRKLASPQYMDLATAVQSSTSSLNPMSFVNGTVGQWKMGAVDNHGEEYWFDWYGEQWRYGCTDSAEFPFPYMDYRSVAHPCVSETGDCCRGAKKTRSLIRYFFSGEQRMLSRELTVHLTMSRQEKCGDGQHVMVYLQGGDMDGPQTLLSHRMLPSDEKQNEPFTFKVTNYNQDTWMDVVIDPLANHNCDGVYLAIRVTS